MMNEHLTMLLVAPCLAVLLLVAAVTPSYPGYAQLPIGISRAHIVTSAVISMRLSAVAFFALQVPARKASRAAPVTATRFHPVPSIRIVSLPSPGLLGTAHRFHPGRSLRQSRRVCRAGRTKAAQVSLCSK